MHFLHCILVRLDEEDIKEMNNKELMKKARKIAMSETEEFGDGNVFDWREDENAGRWSDTYPGIGVILGKEDKEKFLSKLKEWSDKPLKEAIDSIRRITTVETKWRTEQEIKGEEKLGIVKLKLPRVFYGEVDDEGDAIDRNGRKVYWSGKNVEMPLIDEEFLRTLWQANKNYENARDKDSRHIVYDIAYPLYKAMKLALGNYDTSSYFYSVPDYSSNIGERTMSDAEQNPELFALVFSDYHN